MHIEILDPVWSRLFPKEEIDKILPCLAYENEFWKPGPFHKEQKKEEAYMIHRGSGKFLTGLIPRIEKYYKSKESKVLAIQTTTESYFPPEKAPSLPGFTLRPDQLETVEAVIQNQRGMIKNATGTGKTVLAGAICSVWPSAHIVFLCHTLDLLQQAQRSFVNQFKFNNVITLGGGKNKFDWPEEPTIVISTIQTFRRLDLLENCSWADIIICDEAHHLNDKKSMMAEILKQSLAPIRIGLSAELPKTEHGKLVLEGFIGPVIGDFSYAEGVSAGVLAKPKFSLIPVPWSDEIGCISHYGNKKDDDGNLIKGMYTKGIIENKARNRLALSEAVKSINAGESVLILTARDTAHGKILKEMAMDIFELDIPFIFGDTEKEDRQNAQDALESKDVKCVISNVVWREGINIKSLNHVINVGGEKAPTQIVGRGSRATTEKKWVKVTDFIDPYKWLSHHTCQRLIVYATEGWMCW